MAKCTSCQHKITQADRDAGKCPECGAPIAPLSGTAQPGVTPSAEKAPGAGTAAPSTEHVGPIANPQTADEPTGQAKGTGTAAPPPEQVSTAAIASPATEKPGGTGTAVPPSVETATDDQPFDAYQTVKPHADMDRTIIEQSLGGEFAATQAGGLPTFNASVTSPMEEVKAPIERTASGEKKSAAQTKKPERGKETAGPETYLVIQPRDVQRGFAAVEQRSDYEVSDMIGEGGMGVVYQARQASLDRDVALKMVKPRELDEEAKARYTVNEMQRVEKALQKRDREWFLSEAVVTANLEHPYIVPIYDVIKDRQDSLFYAMKWVRGIPWNKSIRDKSINENLEILLKVGDAVAFAHDKGVIHRDLKPENVMVGDHGEVYVMDWGAALVTPDFERSTNFSQSSSGFGSPLYAAPELFLGTVDQIGARSDVYLLGAILFEIISGYPPHPYPSNRSEVLTILRSNEVRPTDYKGELLDIALKAMAADQANRYASAQEFQTAIREYQQHNNSRTLSKRARANLVKAEQTGDYADYQRAVFAYDEACEMWHGNDEARAGVGEAKLAYATAALKKGAYDLGLEVADPNEPAHGDVIVRLHAAQKDRESQKRRLKTTRRVAAGLAAMFLIGLTVATIWINNARKEAIIARDDAVKAQAAENAAKLAAEKSAEQEKTAKLAAIDAKNDAVKARDAAEKSEMKAKDSAEEERIAKEKEADARKQEEIARMDADARRIEADEQREIAEANEQKAIVAKSGQEYEEYAAVIGLADSKIQSAAFDDVSKILGDILKSEVTRREEVAKRAAEVAAAAKANPDRKFVAANTPISFRGWEFNRLNYLARQADVLLDPKQNAAGTRDLMVDALAVDRQGRRFVAGRHDGTAVVGSTAAAGEAPTFLNYGRPILAVAFSSNGALIATAGEAGPDGSVQIWSAKGKPIGKPFAGDGKAVFSVEFAERAGQIWLLTAGADKSAQVWEVSADGQHSAKPGRPLLGHNSAVRRAIFSPDASQIVTVGDDSIAVVWELSTQGGQPQYTDIRKPFMLHKNSILAAAFSPDGKNVLTADVDGRMYVWAPARLNPRIIDGTSELRKLVKDEDKLLSADRGKTAVVNDNLALHDKAVHAVAFSPDGKYIVSGSDDHTVKFQRLRKPGEQAKPDDVITFRGHGGNVRGCALAADSSLQPASDSDRERLNNWFVVSAGHDTRVMRWNVTSYKEAQVFHHDPVLAGTTGIDRDVLSAVFSPDGSTVLTGGRDHHAYQWNVRTGQKTELNPAPLNPAPSAQIRTIEEGHDLPIWTAAYAPKGEWFLTAGMDDRSLLWNTATGTQWARLDRTGVPAVVAISPDGEWVATSASDSSPGTDRDFTPMVQFWNIRNIKNLKAGEVATPAERDAVHGVERHQGRLSSLAFDPGPGVRLFSSFDNPNEAAGLGLVWELKQVAGRSKWTIVRPIEAETHINAAAFRSQGRLLVACEDGTVQQYDLDQKPARRSVVAATRERFPVRLMALHPDGNSLVTVSPVPGSRNVEESAVLHKWNLDTATSTKPIEINSNNVFSLALAEQGDEALIVAAAPKATAASKAAADSKGQLGTVVRRYDLETGRELTATNGRPYLESGQGDNDTRQYWGAIYASAAAGEKAERRILALHGTRAELLNVAGEVVDRSNPHGQVSSVSYSSDGKFFLTAGSDETIKVWDAQTRLARCQIVDPRDKLPFSIQSASFSPAKDSYEILSVGRDNYATLWNWEPKMPRPERARQLTHDSEVRSAAFSHDGAQIVCGCDDGTAWIWNAKNEKQGPRKIRKWDAKQSSEGGHQGAVLSAAFSNGNDDWIVTAGEDNKAFVWDLATLKVHAVLQGHAAAVRCAAFSPDNRRIVTGSADTFAKVWDPKLPSDKQANAGGQQPALVEARELLTLSRHERPVTTVAFSPGDGKTVLTASNDGDTVLWLSEPEKPGNEPGKEPGKK